MNADYFELGMAILFITCGIAGWYLVPIYSAQSTDAQFPEKLITFAIRFIGMLLIVSVLLAHEVPNLPRSLFLIFGLLLVAFAKNLIKVLFVTTSKEFRIAGRVFSIVIFLSGAFILIRITVMK